MNFLIVFISIILFFSGYLFAPVIYKHNIKLLIIYPTWITEKLKKILNKGLKFYTIFLIIISFNASSLFLILISGVVPFLPGVLILWLGINLGISIIHISGEKKHFFLALANPVAILEIIATIITGYASLKFSILNIFKRLDINIPETLNISNNLTLISTIKIFLHYTLPILFLAAVIETIMITIIANNKMVDI